MPDGHDDTILFKITDWWMENENYSRVLHVHGDSAARVSLDVIFAAFGELAKEDLVATFFSSDDLRRRIAGIAEPIGLNCWYGPARCRFDPLDQRRDVSLWRPEAVEGSSIS
jgi:hypothetical protein